MKASGTETKLIVWKCDGTKEVISLDEKPITTFVLEEIVITTSKVSVRYSKSEVLKYTYEGAYNSINNINATENGIYFHQEGNTIIVTNNSKDSHVYIYTVGGTIKNVVESKYGSTSKISLENYSDGVYIISINNTTYKFLKK